MDKHPSTPLKFFGFEPKVMDKQPSKPLKFLGFESKVMNKHPSKPLKVLGFEPKHPSKPMPIISFGLDGHFVDFTKSTGTFFAHAVLLLHLIQ